MSGGIRRLAAAAAVLAFVGVCGCSNESPAGDTAPTGSGITLPTATMSATDSAGTDDASGTGADSSLPTSDGSSPSGSGPKFDIVAPESGTGTTGGEEACAKVDFLFVIDSSNSMATNQAELVASFPEFVDSIEATLVDVESFHVGVVTSDAYGPNEAGCAVMGSLVTQTGGVNSSNATCSPFVEGNRFMTEADNLDMTFACAASVGTAGANNEEMMSGALEAISPALNAAGACNDGFIRNDALLVVVLITDEDDPGSSGVGSAGDPMTWFNQMVAVKTFPENIVLLTLTRGAPANVCGAPQGSEVDGTRLQALAALFGATGFTGDICAPSFGPFFDEAVGVIESACDGFVEPPG